MESDDFNQTVRKYDLDDIKNMSNNLTNSSSLGQPQAIPGALLFTEENLVAVTGYPILFVIGACGNLTVFITLFRNRHVKSRVNLFILHLSIADLIVAFVILPMEITWNATVAWKGGDFMCRFMMFFRTFGLYLSSFILVVISLDRYFAIVHPLSLNDCDKRGKIMLSLAWIFSAIASLPQVSFSVYILTGSRIVNYLVFRMCERLL